MSVSTITDQENGTQAFIDLGVFPVVIVVSSDAAWKHGKEHRFWRNLLEDCREGMHLYTASNGDATLVSIFTFEIIFKDVYRTKRRAVIIPNCLPSAAMSQVM